MLYADRSSEDEECLMTELFQETKNTNKASSLNLNVQPFCDSQANLYNAANMAGHKQSNGNGKNKK
jgi:hypothetical protein